MNDKISVLPDLLSLSHALGDPSHEWAMLGEGNTSAWVDDDTFLVKASGSQLATMGPQNLCHVQFRPILEALNSTRDYSDESVKDLLFSSCVGESSSGLKPSVETLLHAFLLTLDGIKFVGHTHVTAINGILCSARGWKAMQSGGRLFPDEIVVCGPAPCCVPYVDPGVPLARALRDAVREYVQKFGTHPKTIYLQNHGFIALARTAPEVVNIHRMAEKAAKILLGTFNCGGPTFLTQQNVDRIYTRPDEHYRQKALGLTEDTHAA